MKKIIALTLSMLFLLCGCGKADAKNQAMEPQITHMRNICELATTECYYHNVAKFKQENAKGFLWFSKDKNFWIEYSGQVSVGVDASLVTIAVKDDTVSITLPPAKVLGCKVDENTLNTASFIVAENSAAITAEDEITALKEAQTQMLESVSGDSVLLENARQRAQFLLEDYVQNIGNCFGKHYCIEWIDVDANGNVIGSPSSLPEVPPETTQP